VKITKTFWPQISETNYFSEIFTNEEKKFEKSLEKGTKDILNLIANLKKLGKTMISGDEAFGFYETSGLPLEVTTDIAKEQGIEVESQGFEEAFKNTKKFHEQASKRNLVDTA